MRESKEKMTYQDKIRDKLANKIFPSLGKTVTLINKTSPIYNTRGEIESWTQSTSNLVLVPYNVTKDVLAYKEFGQEPEGSFDAAVPYDTVININDVITMDSTDYNVTKILVNPLPNNVVTIIRLTKA